MHTDTPLSCIMSAAKCAQVPIRVTVTRTEEPTESRRTFKVPSLPPPRRPEGTSEDQPPVHALALSNIKAERIDNVPSPCHTVASALVILRFILGPTPTVRVRVARTSPGHGGAHLRGAISADTSRVGGPRAR
jgi:hypothetical protein